MPTRTAAVCRCGHVASNDVVDLVNRGVRAAGAVTAGRSLFAAPGISYTPAGIPMETLSPNCGSCGAPVITKCDRCSTPIPEVNYAGGNNQGEPNPFCVGCGEPFPWATREQRIGSLYNLIDFGVLTPAEELEVADAIAVLSLPEDEADLGSHIGAGETIKRLAPGAWRIGQPVLVATLSGALQTALHVHGGG